MFYLPRLFVYHVEALPGGEASETFKVMERRLLKLIMTPAMIATWVLGLVLLYLYDFTHLQNGYMHAKLLLVFLMSGLHGYYARAVRQFAVGKNTRSSRFWRIMNEAPTVLLIGIVFLVIMKPF